MTTRPEAAGRRLRGDRVPRFAAVVCFLIGASDVIVLVSPALRDGLGLVNSWLPGVVSDSAGAASLVIGVLLILLAHGLSRRKRRAFRAVLVLLAVSATLHVIDGPNLLSAGIAIAAFAFLFHHRDEFYAQGDPHSRWQAVRVFVVLLTIDFVIGFFLVDNRVDASGGSVALAERLQHVALGLVGVTGPVPLTGGSEDVVYFTLLALGILTIVATAFVALRPPEPQGRLDPADEDELRALLTTSGDRDSLGYFGLRRDKSVVWSPSRKSAITYRVVSGVMLASGDPHGDVEAWPGAIQCFVEIAGKHAWVPAVVGCSERGAEVWAREAGLEALEIGDEAVLDTRAFSLDGRPMRNVRQSVRRIERAGYCTQVRLVSDLTPSERDRLRADSDRWRGTETERGFSMALGRFGDPADAGCVIVTAHDDTGMRALLHFVPWGRDGLSLDLMRRDVDCAQGVNEALIVAMIEAAPAFGATRLSLNFAAFRGALERGERIGAGPISRAWRTILVFASRWFQIESLYRFMTKFGPEWVPRYLVYPDGGDLPRVCAAALEAEAFLVFPRWRRRR